MSWLHITSVLYNNDEAGTERLVTSTSHSAALARDAGRVERITYAVGDSSPTPAVSPECLERLVAAGAKVGVDVSYEFFDANLGSAEGNNALMRDVGADYFLMVNPDCYASPGLASALLARMDDPKVGIAEARQVPFDHPKYHDPDTGETSWASMACCLIRGETFREVGELDSSTFFLYCDDVDYSWRTRLKGWTLAYTSDAVVFHDKRLSQAGQVAASSAEEYYAAEAALFLTWKYSRPDITEHFLAAFKNGTDAHQRARKAFKAREAAGRLPAQLDPDHKVAQFIEGNYARHRF